MLRSLGSSERRTLLRRIARDIQKSQSARIGRQQYPEGKPFGGRRERKPPVPGNRTPKFLYPDGDTANRLVLMKSWFRDGPLITGYDIQAGGIRSFFYDRITHWLGVAPEEQNKGAGKFRRQGRIRNKAMFRKLRSTRNLRSDATDREAWIGFSGRAAEIARIHQESGADKPALKAKPVRYARRELLGLTDVERSRILDAMLAHIPIP